MNRDKFLQSKEFLYHLTNSNNLNGILENKIIYCTNFIIDSAYGIAEEDKAALKTTRRKTHTSINFNGHEISIRDQKPLSPVALPKCLTEGWTTEDFINLLNGRVFFWPNMNRLWSHYKRYSNEHPIIIRVRTDDMLNLNNHAELCRLNSGATRANSYLGGIAPVRGEGTFLSIEDFELTAGKVAEVTFPNRCNLPEQIWTSGNPTGPWTTV